MKELKVSVDGLVPLSLNNEECLLDVPFTSDEVKAAIGRLKCGKAAGPDGVVAEHLKYAGESMVIWLMNVMNAIVELEVIPDSLKQGLLKRGGKDPLRMDSYRTGITLTSMVAKVLEFLILGRLHSTLLEMILILIRLPIGRRLHVLMPSLPHWKLIAEYLNSGSKVPMICRRHTTPLSTQFFLKSCMRWELMGSYGDC